jgi:hypothetical protein
VQSGVGGGVGYGSGAGIGAGAVGGIVQPGQQSFAFDSKDKADTGTQALVEKFRAKSTSGRTTGILPIRVSFPVFGPSVFLVSELSSASQAPTAALTYERDKKAGKR